MHIETVRFVEWINDGFIKLALKDGQAITHVGGGPHEEGYSWTYTTWEREGQAVYCTIETNSRDCDGPFDTYGKYQADIISDLYESENGKRLHWSTVSRSQRDHYAEAMGY